MNAGGETADQAVRMTLQGIEMAANVALKAGGMASKSLAVTLYAILTVVLRQEKVPVKLKYFI